MSTSMARDGWWMERSKSLRASMDGAWLQEAARGEGGWADALDVEYDPMIIEPAPQQMQPADAPCNLREMATQR